MGPVGLALESVRDLADGVSGIGVDRNVQVRSENF